MWNIHKVKFPLFGKEETEHPFSRREKKKIQRTTGHTVSPLFLARSKSRSS